MLTYMSGIHLTSHAPQCTHEGNPKAEEFANFEPSRSDLSRDLLDPYGSCG